MVIHDIAGTPSPDLQRGLAVYESRFVYPLGDGHFRIDYGLDRTAFIRAIGGEWRLLAAESEGAIVGTIEMAMRELWTPEGERQRAAFFTEVRVVPEARRKIAATRLLQRAAEWPAPVCEWRFCVVNDATEVKPPEYTGRLGLRPYREVARIAHVRFPLERAGAPGTSMRAAEAEGMAAYERLGAGCYRFAPGTGVERSTFTPQWLVHPRGTACGRLEDRRKVMRLVMAGGRELMPAFLSCFAFSDAADGRELLDHARQAAAEMGYGALRLCLGEPALKALRAAGGGSIPAAGAGIYATVDLPHGSQWLINGAEV